MCSVLLGLKDCEIGLRIQFHNTSSTQIISASQLALSLSLSIVSESSLVHKAAAEIDSYNLKYSTLFTAMPVSGLQFLVLSLKTVLTFNVSEAFGVYLSYAFSFTAVVYRGYV